MPITSLIGPGMPIVLVAEQPGPKKPEQAGPKMAEVAYRLRYSHNIRHISQIYKNIIKIYRNIQQYTNIYQNIRLALIDL